jgi:hypothetical protein
MSFNHLNVPDQWNQYYTKYPEGYTILEALLNWVQQVNNMTDNINDWNAYLDEFKKSFDSDLQETVEKILKDWQASGLLQVIISQALETEINDVKEDLQQRMINVMFPPFNLSAAVGNGEVDDYQSIQDMIDYCFENNIQKLYFPQPTNYYKITKPLLLKTTSQNAAWWDGKAIKLFGADKATTKIVKTTNNTLAGVNAEVDGVDATILLYDDTDGGAGAGIQLKHIYIENQSSEGISYAVKGQACQRMIIDDVNFKSRAKGLHFYGMFSSTLRDIVIECLEEALRVDYICTSNLIEKIFCASVKNPYYIRADYSHISLLYADGATGTVFDIAGLGLEVTSLGTESPKAQYILKNNDFTRKIQVQSLFCFRQTGDSDNGLNISDCAIFYGQGDFIVHDLSILNNDVINGNSYIFDCGSNAATNSVQLDRISYYHNVGGNPNLLFSKTAGDIGSGGKWNTRQSSVIFRKNGIMPYLGSTNSKSQANVNFRDKAIYLDNEDLYTASSGDIQWMEKYSVGDVLLINNPKAQNKLGYVVTSIEGDLSYVRDCRVAEIQITLKGTTAERPAQNLFVALQYFDTTLNKPIWWTGYEWVDAMGATV